MGLDLDYIAGMQAIEELEEILRNQDHGEREELLNEIINFVEIIKEKYES
jgi:hypothetical protein